MGISDLRLKEAAKQAYIAAKNQLAPIQDFAHTYSELEGRFGEAIAVPVYDLNNGNDFSERGTVSYISAEGVGGELVTLDKHYVKSVTLTDRDISETGIQWIKDAGKGIGDILGRMVNNQVIATLSATTITDNTALVGLATTGITSLSAMSKVFKVAAAKDIDIGQATILLAPTLFSTLLACLPADTYGGMDAIRGGRIPGLMGFKSVVCASNLPSGVNGIIVGNGGCGVASRYLEPMSNAYPTTFKAIDPDSGFTIGFREFTDLATGKRYLAGEVLFGAKLIDTKRVVKLLNA